MKTVLFRPTEEQIAKIKNTITIDSMIFCYATVQQDEQEGDKVMVGLVYAAKIGEEILVLGQNFLEPRAILASQTSLFTSGYMEGPNANDNIFRGSNFFISNKKMVATDFVGSINEETGLYEFYGFTQNNEVRRYAVNKTMMQGLNIMNRSIKGYLLDNGAIRETNLWLSNENEARLAARYINVDGIEICDISVSNKKYRKMYTGVVAFRFKGEDQETKEKCEIPCIMVYYRSNKSKRKDLKSFVEMKNLYGKAAEISNYAGQTITENGMVEEVQVLAHNAEENRPYVMNLTRTQHESFLQLIEQI